MTQQVKFKFGTDVEVFLKEKKTGRLVSAHEVIPGSKDKPHKLKYGQCHPDSVACEFAITPCTTFKQFNSKILHTLKELKYIIGPDLELVFTAKGKFQSEYWKNLPEYIKRSDCGADFYIGGNYGNLRLITQAKMNRPNTSFAGGHVHIGWTDGSNEEYTNSESHLTDCMTAMKHLTTSWCVVHGMLPGLTEDRQNIFDREDAGFCNNVMRPKPYGVEFRAPSNLWCKSLTGRKLMWNMLQSTEASLTNGIPRETYYHSSQKILIDYWLMSNNIECINPKYVNPSKRRALEKIAINIAKTRGMKEAERVFK